MIRALCVDKALRSAADVGVSNVLRNTLTSASSSSSSTPGIGATGRWVAGVHHVWGRVDGFRDKRAAVEGVSGVSCWTGTDGIVVYSRTSKIMNILLKSENEIIACATTPFSHTY